MKLLDREKLQRVSTGPVYAIAWRLCALPVGPGLILAVVVLSGCEAMPGSRRPNVPLVRSGIQTDVFGVTPVAPPAPSGGRR